MSTLRPALLSLLFAATFGWTAPLTAQEAEPATREAAKHFQRGVALYGEADYRAALVEFRRAYSLAPNAAVLYNVGETEYQLQDYAGALTTFRRYVVEASASDSHRAEVDADIEVLRARVGHVSVSTSPAGADVVVDDQPIGKTPLDQPALVSIGHRKIVASLPGRPAVARYVDVAADDNLTVTLQLPSAPEAAPTVGRTSLALGGEPTNQGRGAGPALRIAGWVAAGALAAGAATFAILANKEASELRSARDSFPTSASTLDHDSSLTTTYSLVADSLTAAAIVAGGISLWQTLSAGGGAGRHGDAARGVRVSFGPGAARLDAKF